MPGLELRDVVEGFASNNITRHCDPQLCCGSACASGGHVMAGIVDVPAPKGGNSRLAPALMMTFAGIKPSAPRRPPRL
jgi:hypothetical protein